MREPVFRVFLLYKLSLAGAAENVYNLVLVKFLHVVASRAEVFAGVEFAWFLKEYATNGGGHGQTAVRVNVDFADSALGGLAELLFGDTDGIGKLTAKHVDGINLLLGN